MKRGIRRKIVVFITSAVLIIVVVGVMLGYFWGFNLLRSIVREEYYRIADTLAYSISVTIEEKINDIRTYSSSPLWHDVIIKENLKYETMEDEATKRYLMDSDKTWIDASEDEPLVREYMAKALSVRLKKLEETDRAIGEIFVTDRLGGLVAISRKTSDFYQADEEWWQKAYNKGEGDIFIGNIEFDESSNVWSITFAVPMIGQEDNVIGVCKAIIDISAFFKPLENFRIDKAGHPFLVDEKGYIIFHHEVMPMSMKFASEEDLQKVFKTGWGVIRQPHIHKEDMFVIFAEIEHPILVKRGMTWRVFVSQEVTEVFAPLNTLIVQGALLTGILLLIIVPVGFIFGGLFVRPILKLRHAIERIGKGDLDYRIELKTGDEIEELADSFNKMTGDLKKTTTSIDNLNREIIERKKVEDKLRIAAKEWKRTFDSISDLVFIIDKDFTIVKINETFASVLKMRPEEIVGKKCYKILHKMDEPWEDCPFEKTRKDKKPHTEEVDDVNIGIPLLVTTSPIFDQKGEFIGSVHIAKDITERKKVEETLKKAYKELSKSQQELIHAEKLAAIGQLAAGIAHGINNPLAVISGEAQILLSDTKKDKETKDASKIIIDQAKRVKMIIEGLLEFSHKREPGTKPLDVNNVLEKALSLLRYQAKLKDTKIIKELKPDIPKIYGNENQIQEAFLCIMLNALQAMKKGGRLTIRSRSEKIEIGGRRKADVFKQGQRVVVIEFEDTGEGMDEQLVKRLFEPFFTTKQKGAGLGLPITYKIIEAHKGTIEAHSKLGEGSTFIVRFPVS